MRENVEATLGEDSQKVTDWLMQVISGKKPVELHLNDTAAPLNDTAAPGAPKALDAVDIVRDGLRERESSAGYPGNGANGNGAGYPVDSAYSNGVTQAAVPPASGAYSNGAGTSAYSNGAGDGAYSNGAVHAGNGAYSNGLGLPVNGADGNGAYGNGAGHPVNGANGNGPYSNGANGNGRPGEDVRAEDLFPKSAPVTAADISRGTALPVSIADLSRGTPLTATGNGLPERRRLSDPEAMTAALPKAPIAPVDLQRSPAPPAARIGNESGPIRIADAEATRLYGAPAVPASFEAPISVMPAAPAPVPAAVTPAAERRGPIAEPYLPSSELRAPTLEALQKAAAADVAKVQAALAEAQGAKSVPREPEWNPPAAAQTPATPAIPTSIFARAGIWGDAPFAEPPAEPVWMPTAVPAAPIAAPPVPAPVFAQPVVPNEPFVVPVLAPVFTQPVVVPEPVVPPASVFAQAVVEPAPVMPAPVAAAPVSVFAQPVVAEPIVPQVPVSVFAQPVVVPEPVVAQAPVVPEPAPVFAQTVVAPEPVVPTPVLVQPVVAPEPVVPPPAPVQAQAVVVPEPVLPPSVPVQAQPVVAVEAVVAPAAVVKPVPFPAPKAKDKEEVAHKTAKLIGDPEQVREIEKVSPEGWVSALKTMVQLGLVHSPRAGQAQPAESTKGVDANVVTAQAEQLRAVQMEIRTSIQDHAEQLKRVEEQLKQIRESQAKLDSLDDGAATEDLAERVHTAVRLTRVVGFGLGALVLVLVVMVALLLMRLH
jgi:hypothetical protein